MPYDALTGYLMFLAWGALWYGPWQWACTDVARQHAFEARDALFDMARRGQLRFDSPEYRIIRQSLEAMIRYAHELTWPTFFVAMTASKAQTPEQSDLSRALARIRDDKVRHEAGRLVARATHHIIRMMIFKSPLGVVLYGIGFSVDRVSKFLRGPRVVRDAWNRHEGAVSEKVRIEAEICCGNAA